MIKRRGLIAAVLICSVIVATGQKIKPEVYSMDIKILEKSLGRINAKDAQILPAYNQLINDAEKAMKFGPVSVMEKKNQPPSGNKHDYMSLAPYHWPDPAKPDGLPYIRKDGETNPEVKEYKDKEYLPQLCANVQTLGLAYYFSGEKKYADHAAKLLQVWFLDSATRMNPNFNYAQAVKGVNTGRGAGMIDSRHFVKVMDAIGLIRPSKCWTKQSQEEMKKWVAGFLNWMQTSENGKDELDADNNHGVWYDAQRLALALYIGDSEHARKIVINAADRLDKQMDESGNFPKEMARTNSLHYTAFVMDAFFNIANMAPKAGIDFWTLKTTSGKSLQKGFDVLKPYLAGEKEWTGQQIKTFDFEEGYYLLAVGAKKLKCGNCTESLRQLAAEEFQKLRFNLLY
ncbi:MAG: alginate lyase family protein [Chitinophagaceae bacterium]|nr:alginate lyase family protein [Chitinophagaceae bacterium]